MRNLILVFLVFVLALGAFFFGRSCGPEKVRLDDFDGRLSALEADVSTTKVVAEAAAADSMVASATANHVEGSVATLGEKLATFGEEALLSSGRLARAEERLNRVSNAIAAERNARQAAVAQLNATVSSVSSPSSPPATIALAPAPRPAASAAVSVNATTAIAVPSDGEDRENDTENNLNVTGSCWSASRTNLKHGENTASVLTRVDGGDSSLGGCFLTKEAAIAAACGGANGRLVSSGDGVDVVECDRVP